VGHTLQQFQARIRELEAQVAALKGGGGAPPEAAAGSTGQGCGDARAP